MAEARSGFARSRLGTQALQWRMRTLALILLATGIGLAVDERPPQQIVYARVSPNPNGLGLFIASADGSDERPLLAAADLDYDPAFAPDGQTIVFTSER